MQKVVRGEQEKRKKNIAYSRAIIYIPKTGDFRLQTVTLKKEKEEWLHLDENRIIDITHKYDKALNTSIPFTTNGLVYANRLPFTSFCRII